MDTVERHEIVVDGVQFNGPDDLEDYCFSFPGFEDAVIDSGLMSWPELARSVDTYLIVAELEYGDGCLQLPYEMRYGRYGDVIVETCG